MLPLEKESPSLAKISFSESANLIQLIICQQYKPIKTIKSSRMRFCPYVCRLNVVGTFAFILICTAIYVLYTISTPAPLRHIPNRGESADQPPDDGEEDPFQINLKKLLIACIRAAEAGGSEVYRIRKAAIFDNNDLGAKSKGLTKEGAHEMVTRGDLASHQVMVHGLSATFPGLEVISEEDHHDKDTSLDEDTVDIVRPFHLNNDPFILSDELKALPLDKNVPLKLVTVWIDPLDATQEYTELNDEGLLKYVTTMVCVALNGKPVIGVIHKPFEHKTFWGWTGHGHSAAVKEMNRTAVLQNRTSSHDVVIVSRSHPGEVEKFIRDKLGPQAVIVHAGGAGYKALQVMEGHADAYIHNSLIKKWDICAPNALLESVNGRMTTLTGQSISYTFDDGVRNEDGVLAAANYVQHQKFFQKMKAHA